MDHDPCLEMLSPDCDNNSYSELLVIELDVFRVNQVQSSGGFTAVNELQLTDRHLGGGNHHGGTLYVTAAVPGFQRGRPNIQNLLRIGNTHAGNVTCLLPATSQGWVKVMFSVCPPQG